MSAAGEEEFPPVPYTRPAWAAVPAEQFSLEVMKEGSIIEEIPLAGKDHFLVGRLPNCDISSAHPSLSRYHAVIQYSEDGSMYVFDLGSTHGTSINKIAIAPKRFVRLPINHMVKFGLSSRFYLLKGSGAAMEQAEQEAMESERKFRARLDAKRAAKAEKARRERDEDEAGIDWGMGPDPVQRAEDADDDDDGDGAEPTPDARVLAGVIGNFGDVDMNQAPFHKDPKKAIRVYFERETDLAEVPYETEQTGPGHARVYVCTLRVPYGDYGEELLAEASVQGRKKEAVVQCALEACKMLHMRGLLYPKSGSSGQRVSSKKAAKLYSAREVDDDDDFYDRSGDVQRRKQRKAGGKSAAASYESLAAKLNELEAELKSVQDLLQQAQAAKQSDGADAGDSGDELDAFMSNISSNAADTKKLKARLRALAAEMEEVRQLKELAAPVMVLGQAAVAQTGKPKTAAPPPSAPAPVQDMPAPAAGSEANPAATPEDVPTAGERDSKPDSKAPVAAAAAAAAVRSSPPPPQQTPKPKSASHAVLEASAPDEVGGLILPDRKKKKRKRAEDEGEAKKKAAVASTPETTTWDWEKKPEEEWVPPAHQDGSGRTSLNDKLGY